MTEDPLDKIRDGLLRGVATEPRRTRRRRIAAGAAAVAVLVAGSGFVLASPWDESTHDAVTATEGTGSPDADDEEPAPPEPQPIWTIAEPPGWHREGRELMPNLGWDTLTLATIPLRKGGDRCAQMPEQALRDLGADDALISIFFDVSPPDGAAPWPAGPSDLPEQEDSTAEECAERDDLEVHWGHAARAGVAFYVLVALGPEAGDAVRDQTWATLASFRPTGGPVSALAPECVVTVPPSEPAAMPTTTDDAGPPPGTGWFGTADLWTALPDNGVHQRRKSAWWSRHFPGGSVEERPEIGVTWERLDEDRPPVVAGPPGTNAHSVDTGWFMISGIDPEDPGCWRVTARYKGHELSYVYWNATSDPTADDDRCAVDGSTTVVVPDVVGMPLARAIDTAMAAGLEVVDTGTPEGDPIADEAVVTSQEPPAGARVPEDACLGVRTAMRGTASQQGPHIGDAGESAKDIAERFMDDVLNDPSVVLSANDVDRRTTVVRLETSRGALVDATVIADPLLGRLVLREVRSPGLELDESRRATITVPEPGVLTLIGYDGALSPPGEVMIDGEQVTEAGPIGPVDLVESSWVRIDLEATDGRVLHLVQMRG